MSLHWRIVTKTASNRLVLLIDDEAIIRMSCEAVLRRDGYRVVTAADGNEALDAMRRYPEIGLVIMDLDLGSGSDGAQLARQILALREVPVVFLTCHSEREMVESVNDITTYGYVLKSTGEHVLMHTVRRAFDHFEAHRGHASVERRMVLDLLSRINAEDDAHELLQNLARLLSEWSGCEAVGIRLQEGEDYPYFETVGFPPRFVELERSLCELDDSGAVVRDPQGNPCLECMCGTVIRGRTNPQLPFFTSFGSFWTNSTSALLGSTSEEARRGRTRNRCNGEGYESVALTPIRWGRRTMGLLQLNDRRPNRFSAEFIGLLEQLASSLALGLGRRAETAALQISEQLTASVMAAAPHPTILINPDRTVRYANPAFERLSLFSAADVQGVAPPYPWWPPEESDWIGRQLDHLLSDDGATVERHFRSRDGQPFWVEISATPVCVNDHLDCYAENWVDITARKESERALRENGAALRASHRMAGTGSWQLDLGARELRLSPEALILFGTGESVVAGRPRRLLSFIHPEDRSAVLHAYLTTLRREQHSFEFEHRIVRSDGAVRIIYQTCEHVRDRSGRAIRSVGVLRDVTRWRQRAQVQEARLRLVDYSADHSTQELLQRFVDEVETVTQSETGFCHLVTDDQKRVSRRTWSSAACEQGWHLTEFDEHDTNTGAWADCIRERRPVVCNDYATARYRRGVRADHAPPIRLAVVPVIRGGTLVAILGVVNKATNYDYDDVALMTEMASFALDIIVRRSAEESLATSRANLSSLIENTDGRIWSVDREYRLLTGNRHYLDTAQTALGRTLQTGDDTLSAEAHGNDPDAWRNLYDRALAGEQFSVERSTDGEAGHRYTEYFLSPIRDVAGAVTGVTIYGRDTTDRHRAQESLSTALEARTALMQEMNHRIKNNLMLVSALIELKESAAGPPMDLRDLRAQVAAISTVHEKLSENRGDTTIRIRNYLMDLVTALLSSYPGPPVAFTVDVEDRAIPAKTVVPLGLIVNEITTNAVKYGFSGTGADTYSLAFGHDRESHSWRLQIASTGRPFPSDVDFKRPVTLGLRLINALVSQLSGTIELSRAEGACYTIAFPESKT